MSDLKRWRAMIVLMIPVLTGFGPCTSGPRFVQIIPGGVLNGDVVTETVGDWSFTPRQGLCALETRPGYPHSVTVFCFRGEEKLYVGCRSCTGKVWSGYVSEDNRARISIEDRIYPVLMNRLAEDELNRTWAELRGGDDGVPPLPEDFWLFELTSRQ